MSWGGRRAQAMRAQWRRRLPLPCPRCGLPVTDDQRWHVGHRLPVRDHPDLQWDETNTWPEHAACNLAAGTRIPTVPATTRRPW
jgi:5-methylcytosine-specific restriction endonuclease McrA